MPALEDSSDPADGDGNPGGNDAVGGPGNHDDEYIPPDPNRPMPIKYNPIMNWLREKLLKDWGQYGKMTTWDVSSEFKERHRVRTDRERVTQIRKEKAAARKKKEDYDQFLKDNFQHKLYLQEQAEFFAQRRALSKERMRANMAVASKRVLDRETVGRVTAEARAKRLKAEAEALAAAQEKARLKAEHLAKRNAEKAAEARRQAIEDDDEFADNLARKFGVYEAIPRYAPPLEVPALPPKQSTHVVVGWIPPEEVMHSDASDEEYSDEEPDDAGGGKDGRLTCDLHGYAYAETLEGKRLGQPGAKALAEVLTPKSKGTPGQPQKAEDVEPGACEPVTKLVLRYNDLHLHGTRYISVAFQMGALPALQHLDLAGNKLSDSGARYIGEALASKTCLKQLKSLDLRANVITDTGAHTLASAFYHGNCKKLETVILADNWIGSNGILALVRALSTQPYKKRLRKVSLRRNRLRPKMMKRLRTDHPKWLSL